jgi:hypothetical protein
MRRVITTLFILAVAMLPTAVFAGQIWTDGNGDGLPDTNKLQALPSDNVTVSIWFDTQSFEMTYYQTYIQRDPCVQFVGATYEAGGGTTFPIDNFQHPFRTGHARSGLSPTHGVYRVGTITFHVEAPINCCVVPHIDGGDAPYSIIGNNATGGYAFFQSRFGTCWEGEGVSTEPTSWGNIKGLYQ